MAKIRAQFTILQKNATKYRAVNLKMKLTASRNHRITESQILHS